jgi:inner membrane protein
VSSETAHFLVGAALALPAIRSRELTAILPAWTIPISAGLLATTPDLDLVLRRIFGFPVDGVLGHRGLFHSPFFLVFASGVLAAMFAGRHSRKAFAMLWLVWGGCMLTHPFLDAFSTGGRGLMLLLPFTRARVSFPWHVIQTPSQQQSLFRRAWLLRPSEIPFFLAAAGIGIGGLLARKRGMDASAS